MLCTIGILGGYLLSSLSVLFLGRLSSNTDHLEAADFLFTNVPMKRGLRANNMAAHAFKRGSLHHGPIV